MQTMNAWQLDKLGGALKLVTLPVPEARPGSVVVKLEASALLTYLAAYVAGQLPTYQAPDRPFTPGSNCVGTIHAIGRDVWHLQPGQRVVTSPHLVAQENVAEPAQILIGVTAFGGVSKRIQDDWPDGTLAEYMVLPRAAVTPVEGLDALASTQLATTMRYVVPFGGLQRGRLAAGETVIVTGASGAFGGAAVLVALAMGAGRVVAVGRNADALRGLVAAAPQHGARIVPVVLTGDLASDTSALRAASDGGAQLAFDMLGRATDPNATLAALGSLRRNGRLVLMGSMVVPMPIDYTTVMRNNWEIIGHYMYEPEAVRKLLALVRSGLLDLSAVTAHAYPLAALPAAMTHAAKTANLDCVVVTP